MAKAIHDPEKHAERMQKIKQHVDKRIGMSKDDAERWLAPNLGYDPEDDRI